MSLVGLIVAIRVGNPGAICYPIALVITTLPCAWLGGPLHRRWEVGDASHSGR